MSEYLFSYGTLQKEKVQLDLFGRILAGAKDELKGYQTSLIEIKDPLFLAKDKEKFQQTVAPSDDKTNSVYGTALEVTEEELLITDEYEPNNYKRIKVKLESGKEAWIYIADKTT